LNYFTSDDSADDVDSEQAYAGKRREQEEGILAKLRGRMDKALGDEVSATLHGVVPKGPGDGVVLSRADNTKQGDSHHVMEQADGGKNSLRQLFASAEKEQEKDA
jgi:hypothetical protein